MKASPTWAASLNEADTVGDPVLGWLHDSLGTLIAGNKTYHIWILFCPRLNEGLMSRHIVSSWEMRKRGILWWEISHEENKTRKKTRNSPLFLLIYESYFEIIPSFGLKSKISKKCHIRIRVRIHNIRNFISYHSIIENY